MTKQPDPLREWWDGLTADEQWEAYRIEKSDALALHTTDTGPHPDEPHEFRTTCRRCGEPGFLNITLHTYDERVTVSKWEAKP